MSESLKNSTTDKQTLQEAYEELLAKAEERQPGISDLLALYGDLQKGLEESQAYLRMFQTTYVSNATSSTF